MDYKIDKDRVKEYFKNKTWYYNSIPEFEILTASKDGLSENEKSILSNRKIELVNYIAELLESEQIALAQDGEDYDIDRKPIDTIVIHHSGSSSSRASNPETYINALELIMLYAPVFKSKKRDYGMWSGHFFNNKMTFIPYHYLIYKDGSFSNPLKDEYIGWHAGNWDVNTRSIAITFVDDLENREPTEMAILTARDLIKKYPNAKLVGHSEVSPTVRPGNLFNIKGGWKDKLL